MTALYGSAQTVDFPGSYRHRGTPGYLSRGHDRIWGLAGSTTAAVQRSEQWSLALSRLAATLQTSIQKGYVTDCSGECKGFAEYPQVYGTYPWGSGSALAFLAVQLFREENNDRAE
ncbi:MAG: hypothetical protein ACLURV_11565 [Gallintestinimicrobium sp.]